MVRHGQFNRSHSPAAALKSPLPLLCHQNDGAGTPVAMFAHECAPPMRAEVCATCARNAFGNNWVSGHGRRPNLLPLRRPDRVARDSFDSPMWLLSPHRMGRYRTTSVLVADSGQDVTGVPSGRQLRPPRRRAYNSGDNLRGFGDGDGTPYDKSFKHWKTASQVRSPNWQLK